jgi:transposase-like protein
MSLTITRDEPHKPAQRRISAQVRAAIDAMVWQGLNRAQAAQAAGLKDNSLYVAMRKPEVKRYYLDELDVLRTSERARNFHTLCEVRDQTSNQMARVNAIAAMNAEQSDGITAAGQRQSPGVTIIIEAPRGAAKELSAVRSEPSDAVCDVTYQRVDGD